HGAGFDRRAGFRAAGVAADARGDRFAEARARLFDRQRRGGDEGRFYRFRGAQRHFAGQPGAFGAAVPAGEDPAGRGAGGEGDEFVQLEVGFAFGAAFDPRRVRDDGAFADSQDFEQGRVQGTGFFQVEGRRHFFGLRHRHQALVFAVDRAASSPGGWFGARRGGAGQRHGRAFFEFGRAFAARAADPRRGAGHGARAGSVLFDEKFELPRRLQVEGRRHFFGRRHRHQALVFAVDRAAASPGGWFGARRGGAGQHHVPLLDALPISFAARAADPRRGAGHGARAGSLLFDGEFEF